MAEPLTAIQAPHMKSSTQPTNDTQDEFRSAVEATSRAAQAWAALALKGDPLARAVSEVLSAVAGAAWCKDLAALTDKGGPVRWARALAKPFAAPGRALFVTRAEAARELLAVLGARVEPEELAARAFRWCESRGVSTGFLDLSPDTDAAERILSRMKTVALRARPDAKAYAVAALEGWGLSATAARDRMKSSDGF